GPAYARTCPLPPRDPRTGRRLAGTLLVEHAYPVLARKLGSAVARPTIDDDDLVLAPEAVEEACEPRQKRREVLALVKDRDEKARVQGWVPLAKSWLGGKREDVRRDPRAAESRSSRPA